MSVPALAASKTVYHKGKAVYWGWGRTANLYAYSEVSTSYFTHSAGVNGVNSGWKSPGKLAKATKWTVAWDPVQAYWSCK